MPPAVCWSTGDCAATGERSAKPIRHTAHNLIVLRKPRMYNPIMPLVELATDRQSNRNTPAGQCDPRVVLEVGPICHRMDSGNLDKFATLIWASRDLMLLVRSAEWRAEQDCCLHEIERHRAADQSLP